MADDNLVLEHLHAIRTVVDRIESDHGDRLDRIESRLSTIEETIGHLYAQAGGDRDTVRALARRIDRIERRLELTDG